MKKILSFVLCALLAVAVLVGCSDEQSSGDSVNSSAGDPGRSDVTEPDPNGGEFDLSAYKAPAEVVEIDPDKEDPSNDAIRFVYDDEGRISQCYYEIDGQQVYLSYTYMDDHAQIFAVMGGFVAADEQIELPGEYDASMGFTSSNGYYFKGYEF